MFVVKDIETLAPAKAVPVTTGTALNNIGIRICQGLTPFLQRGRPSFFKGTKKAKRGLPPFCLFCLGSVSKWCHPSSIKDKPPALSPLITEKPKWHGICINNCGIKWRDKKNAEEPFLN